MHNEQVKLRLASLVAKCGSSWAADPASMLQPTAGPMPAVTRHTTPNGTLVVVPVIGLLAHRTHDGGDTSYEGIAQNIERNSNASGILLDIVSGGGSMFGLSECCAAIRNSAIPCFAIANSYASGAAYMLGAACRKFFISPGGKAGGVGIMQLHADTSGALSKAGIKPTFISAGKYKVERNPFEPLTDEAKARWQQEVDREYMEMVDAVVKDRGVKRLDVMQQFGRNLSALEAERLGAVDAVLSYDQLLHDLGVGASVGTNRISTPDLSRADLMRSLEGIWEN